MARPTKKGLEYYAVDTDRFNDIKLKKLKNNFGCVGLSTWDYIVNEAYRVEGSFLQWDNDTAFDVADYFSVKESVVNEIVAYCCSVGLFDKELYTSEKILTSKRIQNTYVKVCKDAKRKNVNLSLRHDLIGLHGKKPQFPREETPVSTGESTQRIVKNSIEEKRREKSARALEFLKNNFPARWEQEFLIKYAKKIQDRKKFTEDFNDTVDKEDLEYTDKKLFARLGIFSRNWIKNQDKFISKNQDQPTRIAKRNYF